MPEFLSLSPSSSFPEEVQLRDEITFRKTETVANFCATKVDEGSPTSLVTSSPIKKQILLESHAGNSSDTCYSYDREQRAHLHMEKHMIGIASAASHSLPRAVCHDLGAISNISLQPTSSFMSGDDLNFMGAQVRRSSKNSTYDPSVCAAACKCEEDEPFESLEELEAQTIGNLLPDDDDLLSGIADGIEYVTQPHGDDVEDLDLFTSVGGIDLGDDGITFGQNKAKIYGGSSTGSAGVLGSNGIPFGEHPSGERPSRTLFVRNINSNIEDFELRRHFEKFGDIHTLYTACKSRGFVMVSYFDIRSARNAMKALHNKPLMQRKLDIHFSIPKDNLSEKDLNQGTLVVFNLDSSVSDNELHKIFGVYGDIKKIHDTPFRSDQKFIEFYDVRAAEAARHALDWSDFGRKQNKAEPSLPGGAQRFVQPISSDLDEDGSSLSLPRNSPSMNFRAGFSGPFSHGGIPSYADNQIHGFHPASGSTHRGFAASSFDHLISSSLPNIFPSLERMGSVDPLSGISKSGSSLGEMKLDFQSNPSFHPPMRSDFHDQLGIGFSCSSHSHLSRSFTTVPSEINENQLPLRVSSNGASIETIGDFSPVGNGSCPPSGHRSIWRNMQHPQPQNMMWPNSPSFANGFPAPNPQPIHAAPRAQNDMLTAFVPVSEHHVGSAPSENSSLWDRHAYSGESPDDSMFHPGSLGNIRVSGNSPHPMEFVPHNIFPGRGKSRMDMAVSSKNVGFSLPHQRNMMFPARGKLIPTMNDFGSPNERTRHRRSESASNQSDNKKQFELDVDRIAEGDDKRTTLMIKNIPNKYTSKMLLAAIDEQHRGTYDFIYLPIDFKNKCNVGYAFINMIDTSAIIPFYQAFNGKKWEKFNSEKVANIAYARIQGKASLIAHFQNSSLMNEDKRCRPILFHTDGPNAGDQVPFPVGVNIRPRFGKSGTNTSSSEHNRKENPQNSLKDETPSD